MIDCVSLTKDCENCNGDGRVWSDMTGSLTFMPSSHDCPDCDGAGYAPKIERALVAFSENGKPIIMHCSGMFIECEVGEHVVDDEDQPIFGKDAPDHGIWVWEGILYWAVTGMEYEEGEVAVKSGVWRQPTPDEWQKIQQQDPPWEHVNLEYNGPNEVAND